MPKFERRAFTLEGLKADESGKIRGHAAVFNSLSEDMWGMRERIKPGAFRRSIREKQDVRALWNHNSDYVLGRTKSGTLTIAEDERGLLVEIDPPDTQWAKDLQESIRRGDVDQMSFGFIVGTDEWHMENDELIRDIIEVKELFDVSPVTYPAYPATDVSVRSFTPEEIAAKAAELRSAVNGQSSQTDAGAAPAEVQQPVENPQARVEILRKRAELALID